MQVSAAARSAVRLDAIWIVRKYIAGIISDLRVGSAYPDAGAGYELEVIAMAVVGGTSLFGGTGTIVGTVVGVILLRSIRNGVILVGVPGLAYNIFVGGIILIAMLLQTGMKSFQAGLDRLTRAP